jgi:hypothetical protein
MLMIQGDTLALLLCAIRHHTCTDTVRACVQHVAQSHVHMCLYAHRYSLHMDVTKSCMAKFNCNRLEEVVFFLSLSLSLSLALAGSLTFLSLSLSLCLPPSIPPSLCMRGCGGGDAAMS